METLKRTKKRYRPAEIRQMKELLRTGMRVSALAPLHYQSFGTTLSSFSYKLYSLSKKTKKKRVPPKTSKSKSMVKWWTGKEQPTTLQHEKVSTTKRLPKNVEILSDRIVIHF